MGSWPAAGVEKEGGSTRPPPPGELAGALVAGCGPVACPLLPLSLFTWLRLCFGAQTFHPPLSLNLLSLKRDRSEKRSREGWGEGPERREMPPALRLHNE